MNDSYLNLELRLLVLRYGRSAVVAKLASLGEGTVEDLDREMTEVALRSSSRTKKRSQVAGPSKRAEADQLVADNPELKRLASLYQARLLLPSLRDVRAFLEAHGIRTSVKSRDAVYPRIIAVLANMPANELARLEQSRSSSRDPDAYSLLAGELMNPSARK